MKIIKELIEEMDDELKGAGDYADRALLYKNTDKVLADMYYNMSLQEMNHHNELHNAVVRMITKYRETNGEPPEAMKAVYDWEHKKDIARAKDVKAAQALYKG